MRSVDDAVRALQELAHLNVLVREPGVLAAGAEDGLLDGLPVVVKDNIAVGGLPLTAGSPALEGYRPDTDSGAVRRLRRAGATVVGQTNMHELARGTTSDNAAHGPVRNPHDPGRTAGGSSGGTAAAVAAGAVRAGLGTDTSGSGRIPAALCGCVGFRPGRGRYPDDGLLHLSPTADTVTVAAATVREAAVLDAVLAGSGDAAPGREVLDVPPEPPAEGIRLGVPRDPCWDRVDADVARVCGRALDLLGEAGVESVEVDLADTVARATEVNLGMTAFEVRDYWARFARTHLGCDFATFVSRLASPDVAEALDALLDGPALSVDQYAALRAERDEVTRRYADLFATHRLDALVFPTVPVTAPAVGAITVRVDGRERDLLLTTIANGTAAPSAGLPAVTVPAGTAADGLPVGLEFDGPAGTDRGLLGLARLAERVLGPGRPTAPDR